jgi:CubicO group peptidase (beta-lactamase class C family)
METTRLDFEALGAFVRERMAHYHVPGAAVGVLAGQATGRGQAVAAGFGVTNTEHPLAVDERTLFQVGSITKTVTGTALMRLATEGRLDLDVPLRRYLPGLRLADEAVAARVTARHLLTHTGGWVGDFFDDCGPGDDALERMLDKVARLPQLAPLGAVWSYNNAGFYLAGRLVEVLTGQTYERAARDLVLDPLGMEHSFFFAAEAISHRVAAGHEAIYEAAGGGALPAVARPWSLARTANPVGGLVSCAADMLRYARLHLGQRPDVLGPEALRAMQTPRVPAANGEHMGLAWFVREAGGVRLLRHNGGTRGQCATLLLAPAQRVALVVLTNSERGDELHQAVTRWVLERALGVVEAEPQAQPVPPEARAELEGRYKAAAADRVIYARDGQLWLRVEPKGGFPTADAPPGEAPPPVRVAWAGPDNLVMLDEPLKGVKAEVLRDKDGRIEWLRAGGRVHRRQAG